MKKHHQHQVNYGCRDRRDYFRVVLEQFNSGVSLCGRVILGAFVRGVEHTHHHKSVNDNSDDNKDDDEEEQEDEGTYDQHPNGFAPKAQVRFRSLGNRIDSECRDSSFKLGTGLLLHFIVVEIPFPWNDGMFSLPKL